MSIQTLIDYLSSIYSLDYILHKCATHSGEAICTHIWSYTVTLWRNDSHRRVCSVIYFNLMAKLNRSLGFFNKNKSYDCLRLRTEVRFIGKRHQREQNNPFLRQTFSTVARQSSHTLKRRWWSLNFEQVPPLFEIFFFNLI